MAMIQMPRLPESDTHHRAPSPPEWDQMHPLLVHCGVRVFANYGLSVHEDPRARGGDLSLAAIVGFNGPQMSGNLALASTPGLLRRAPPLPGVNLSEAQVQSWLGELANQALGVLKQQLLEYGVKIDLCIPTIIQGTGLRFGEGPHTAELTAAGGGYVSLSLDALLAPDAVLRYQPLAPEDQSLAGDDLVFL